MREHYATTYQTESFCAAYRHGVLTIVRLKDGYSTRLDLAASNEFKRNVSAYEMDNDEREPIDRACNAHYRALRKNKYVRALYAGAIIEFNPEPINA